MDKKLEDGTLEYIRSKKLWHFNKNHKKKEFRVIGRFVGDWKNELKNLNFPLTKNVNTSMPLRHGKSYFEQLSKGNIRDYEKYYSKGNSIFGSSFDELKSGVENLPDVFYKMKKSLPLDSSYVKITKQYPGQTWPFHFDNYHALRKDDDFGWKDPCIRRLWIALEDWDWGHYISFGIKNWENWKAGDIVYFDWMVPHSTANSGVSPRISMFLTGFFTKELKEWVDSKEFRKISL